jgi:hypothetical protein
MYVLKKLHLAYELPVANPFLKTELVTTTLFCLAEKMTELRISAKCIA